MQLMTTVALALSALAGTASAAECQELGTPGILATRYRVLAPGFNGNAGNVCGSLWSNLRRFSNCVASETSCGQQGNQLVWDFRAGVGCNYGMVHSTWWEATRNQWGGISCRQV